MPTRIHIQIEFSRPHASTRIQIHSSNQHWEYCEQSMHRGCHLEYSIHKQLGSILLRSPGKKISRFSIHTIPESKRIQKPDTCSRNKKVGF